MKKAIVGLLIFLVFAFCFQTVYAAQTINAMETENTGSMLEIKEEMKTKVDEYTEKYGSETYGTVAYILNLVRWYSIPVCFVLIVVGALYQYVLGTRRLDMKHKGYGIIMTFVTLLVICQVLPLIFAIVVKGWGGQ